VTAGSGELANHKELAKFLKIGSFATEKVDFGLNVAVP